MLRAWRVLVVALLAVGGLAGSAVGASATDRDEAAADAVLRTAGVAWLAQALAPDDPGSVSASIEFGPAHAVHQFSRAYARGDATAPVLAEPSEWVAAWTSPGIPRGLIRVWRPSQQMEISGSDFDAAAAQALLAWDGAGALVEEPWRARWFVLEGTTLTTLSGPTYLDAPLAASYDTGAYATDIAAYLDSAQDMPGVWIGPLYLGPSGTVIPVVAIVLLLAAVAILGARRRRRRRSGEPPATASGAPG